MKFIVGCLVICQIIMAAAMIWPEPLQRFGRSPINPLIPLSDSEQMFYARYQKPATLDTVITEIQRASFCQNLVIPMVDEWKENKDKKNAPLKEKLGPTLWEHCSNYVWSPVVIQDKKK